MGIISGIKYLSIALFVLLILYILYYNISGEAFLPENYYKVARNYAPKVEKHDRETLKKLLMEIKLPPYQRDVFDCTEASAFLEWYLEGAGFHTFIARSRSISHAWVIVELENHERVAIEATMLTENNYNPPGIVEDLNTIYYNPPLVFENPGQMISFVHSIKYPGVIGYTKSEIDWWNSKPFASMEPFKEWD